MHHPTSHLVAIGDDPIMVDPTQVAAIQEVPGGTWRNPRGHKFELHLIGGGMVYVRWYTTRTAERFGYERPGVGDVAHALDMAAHPCEEER